MKSKPLTDEQLVDLLDNSLRDFQRDRNLDSAAWMKSHPELDATGIGLVETLLQLSASIETWKCLPGTVLPDDTHQDSFGLVIADFLKLDPSRQETERTELFRRYPKFAEQLQEFFQDQPWTCHHALDENSKEFDAFSETVIKDRSTELSLQGLQETVVKDFSTDPPRAGRNSPERVSRSLGSLGDYEIIEEIGRGGMGVIYRARQTSLNRIVALKMIRADQLASHQEILRFRAEAEAAARLDHPGIVPIYDIGLDGNRPYYSMALIDGVGLDVVLHDGPLPPKTAAEIVRRTAEAVEVAHQRGIVHRDLKPSNILLAATDDEEGISLVSSALATSRCIPKVTDFGLARQTDLEDSGLTNTGQILGTPSYMPPEQASGDGRVGPLADVYSLGAVLYCLLSGRPPFQAATILDTLSAVLNEDPVPLRQFNRAIPLDLETISLKCLQKRPGDRYHSAGELAADLHRFLKNEPIEARPVSSMERLTKWVRRHPAQSGLMAAMVLLLVAIVAAGMAMLNSLEETRLRETADQYLYFNRIGLAERSFAEANLARARQLLEECPPEKRGWEWYYLDRATHPTQSILQGHREAITDLTYTAEGDLLSTDGEGHVCLWAQTGKLKNRFAYGRLGPFLIAAHFSRDGQWTLFQQAYANYNHTDLALVPTKALLKPGASLATLAPDVRTFGKLSHHINGFLEGIAISPDGTSLLRGASQSGDQSGRIHRLNLEDGSESEFQRTQYPSVFQLEISPDGNYVAATSLDQQSALVDHSVSSVLQIWEAGSGKEVARFPFADAVNGNLRFRPDGQRLALGMPSGVIRLYGGKDFQDLTELNGHSAAVRGISFSADGMRLASASEDRTVRIWDLAGDEHPIVLRGHTSNVLAVAFHPSGRFVASGGQDRTVIIHDISNRQHSEVIGRLDVPITTVGFSADGQQGLSLDAKGRIHSWPLTGNGESRLIAQCTEKVWSSAFSPDGRWLVASHGNWHETREMGTLTLWEIETGEMRRRISAIPQIVWYVNFSSDGRQVLAAGGNWQHGPGVVNLFDVATGEAVFRAEFPVGIFQASLSRDGQILGTVPNTRKPTVDVWDVPQGKRDIRFEVRDQHVGVLSFGTTAIDPESQCLLLGSLDDIVVLDLHTGQVQLRMRGHTSKVLDLEFTPDATRLASAGGDGTVKIWHWPDRQEALTLRGHQGRVSSIAFSRDGNQLLSGGSDGTIRLWDATPRTTPHP